MCLIYVDIRIIYVYMQNRYANMRVKYMLNIQFIDVGMQLTYVDMNFIKLKV